MASRPSTRPSASTMCQARVMSAGLGGVRAHEEFLVRWCRAVAAPRGAERPAATGGRGHGSVHHSRYTGGARPGDCPGYDQIGARRASRLSRRSGPPSGSAPAGGAGWDACCGRPTAGSTACPRPASGPGPTSTRVPTRERTIWWQKALASISKASRLPGHGISAPDGPGRRPTAADREGRPPRTSGRRSTRRGDRARRRRPRDPPAEGPEVVLAEQGVGGRRHGPQIERVGHVPGQAGQQRVGHRPVDHQVPVAAGRWPTGGRRTRPGRPPASRTTTAGANWLLHERDHGRPGRARRTTVGG